MSETEKRIPFPPGGFRTNEQESEWIESIISFRLQEALRKAGLDVQATAPALRQMLLLSLNAASERGASAVKDHYVPGKMSCPKCSFTLQLVTISTVDGSRAPGALKAEACPNGCGPLSAQTWHTEALQVGEQLSQVYEEKQLAHTLIARLHRDGTLSEGQCCSALDMDRVSFRNMVDWRVPL